MLGDLSHMRAVKSEAHQRFAEENVLHSFMMPAKSGDQVIDSTSHIVEPKFEMVGPLLFFARGRIVE